MNEHEAGGPAFPVPLEFGMTLRDWFAGQALAGLLSRGEVSTQKLDAEWAYTAADAMLAERAKK